MVELVAGIALGLLIGLVVGFWSGFSFLKKQLPNLPKPEVKVENHNHIEVPKSPVLQPKSLSEQQSDSTAEFIQNL